MRSFATLILLSILPLGAAQVEPILRDLGVDPEPATIPVEEVLRGGPPPQGIPALGFRGLADVAGPTQDPTFVAQEEATAWLAPNESLIAVSLGGETKLYPLQVLTWHEIANDDVGGVPVAVTFCPLCNSALAFDRRVPARGHVARDDGRAEGEADGLPDGSDRVTVTFGVSGLLYLSNLLMFDDGTGTLWSQLIGEGVIGTLAGHELTRYPAPILSFEDARAAHPDARVLSRDTGFSRPYGTNPYVGYDDADSPPFLFEGATDGRLAPKARVVTIDADEPVAYPFELLRSERVVHDRVAGREIVVFWEPGTTSALGDRDIGSSADVGAAGVFDRSVEGRLLTFEWDDGAFVDSETGSHWSITGRATRGPLAGAQLEPVVHDNTLWFAWAAFRPETRIHGADAAR